MPNKKPHTLYLEQGIAGVDFFFPYAAETETRPIKYSTHDQTIQLSKQKLVDLYLPVEEIIKIIKETFSVGLSYTEVKEDIEKKISKDLKILKMYQEDYLLERACGLFGRAEKPLFSLSTRSHNRTATLSIEENKYTLQVNKQEYIDWLFIINDVYLVIGTITEKLRMSSLNYFVERETFLALPVVNFLNKLLVYVHTFSCYNDEGHFAEWYREHKNVSCVIEDNNILIKVGK